MAAAVLFPILLLYCEAFEGVCESHDCGYSEKKINVVMTASNIGKNADLQKKLEASLGSLVGHSTEHIVLYVLADMDSHHVISRIINFQDFRTLTLKFLDIDRVINNLKAIIEPMQEHFGSKPGSYYSSALFFISVALHKVIKDDKVIMLDIDLKFNADVKQLHELFDDFKDSNIIGIAREAQPVYRHIFNSYRAKHPGTRVGEPPPDGLTGFNSGVLLLNLHKMRESLLYNELLNVSKFSSLAEEYEFKGHLGDQDFYTLISIKHEELFYVLPCQWNRQLCQWWKNHGYVDVFQDYYRCTGDIYIYHGNCNTPIP